MKRFRDTYYYVTDDGKVFSSKTNKFLKSAKDKKGYIRCAFKYKGRLATFKVHRLVAEVYIENKLNKPHVNHINGIKSDNNVCNLEWCTPLENTKHAIDNKLFIPTNVDKSKCVNKVIKKGELNGFSKLTEKDVLEIRAKFKKRVYTRAMLAKEYGVKETCIKDVILRNSWKHI